MTRIYPGPYLTSYHGWSSSLDFNFYNHRLVIFVCLGERKRIVSFDAFKFVFIRLSLIFIVGPLVGFARFHNLINEYVFLVSITDYLDIILDINRGFRIPPRIQK